MRALLPSLADSIFLVLLCPGVLLAALMIRRRLANPLNVLVLGAIGFWLGGKAGVLFVHHRALHSPGEVVTAVIRSVYPFHFHAAAIGCSVVVALYFAFGSRARLERP